MRSDTAKFKKELFFIGVIAAAIMNNTILMPEWKAAEMMLVPLFVSPIATIISLFELVRINLRD